MCSKPSQYGQQSLLDLPAILERTILDRSRPPFISAARYEPKNPTTMVTKSMDVGGMSERNEESRSPPPSFIDSPSGTSLEWRDPERRPGTIFFSRAPIPTAARWASHDGMLVRKGPASRAKNNSRREDDDGAARLLGRQRRRLFLSAMVLLDDE